MITSMAMPASGAAATPGHSIIIPEETVDGMGEP
jgi:hypothetical protein